MWCGKVDSWEWGDGNVLEPPLPLPSLLLRCSILLCFSLISLSFATCLPVFLSVSPPRSTCLLISPSLSQSLSHLLLHHILCFPHTFTVSFLFCLRGKSFPTPCPLIHRNSPYLLGDRSTCVGCAWLRRLAWLRDCCLPPSLGPAVCDRWVSGSPYVQSCSYSPA